MRLAAPERGVDVDERQLGHAQARRARELAHDHLRGEHPAALRGRAELRDLERAVVGLDHRRDRTAFAQRRDVAGRGQPAQADRGGAGPAEAVAMASTAAILPHARPRFIFLRRGAQR